MRAASRHSLSRFRSSFRYTPKALALRWFWCIQKSIKFLAAEPKWSANIAKHGFDPAEFEDAFDIGRAVARPTKPSRTGRERLLLIGTWFGETIVVVILSPLGTEACDVVSVRRANPKERAIYDEA